MSFETKTYQESLCVEIQDEIPLYPPFNLWGGFWNIYEEKLAIDTILIESKYAYTAYNEIKAWWMGEVPLNNPVSKMSLNYSHSRLLDNIIDYNTWEEVFIQVCRDGHLEIAQWLKKKHPNIDSISEKDYTFMYACEYGHLDVAQWLLQEYPTIDIRIQKEYAFRYACKNGHLEVAQWLLSVCADIDIRAHDDYAFRSACEYGHLEVAQWLKKICPEIDVRTANNDAFKSACLNGHLEVMQWLIEYYDISIRDSRDVIIMLELCFEMACGEGYFEMAQWLLGEFPNINIRASNDRAFTCACEGGNLETAQWLYQKCPGIIRKHFRRLIEDVYEGNNNLEMTRWITKTFLEEISR